MSKSKKHNKQNTPNRSDRYEWMKDSKGIPALQESSIELILKPKQKVEIPLAEYRAIVENAFAVKVFARGRGFCKSSLWRGRAERGSQKGGRAE